MIITEKMIKELQRRIDVSYEEAERYLRRAGGNLDIAEAYAYRRANSFIGRIFREFEKLINATLIYRIRLYKKEDLFINLPVFYFIVFALIIGMDKSLFVGVVFIIFSLVADCNIEIVKVERDEPFSFYKTVDKSKTKSEKRSGTTYDQGYESYIEQDDQMTTPETDQNRSNTVTTQQVEGMKQQHPEGITEAVNIAEPDNGTTDENEYYEVTIDK